MNFTFLSLKETKKEIVQHNTVMFILAENTAANSNKKLLLLFLFLCLSNGTWCLFPFHQSNRFLYQFFFFLSLACGWQRLWAEQNSHLAFLLNPSLTKMRTPYVGCIISSAENPATRNDIWYERFSFAWWKSNKTC